MPRGLGMKRVIPGSIPKLLADPACSNEFSVRNTDCPSQACEILAFSAGEAPPFAVQDFDPRPAERAEKPFTVSAEMARCPSQRNDLV